MKAADRKSSRPQGCFPTGAKVPIRLTINQDAYCRRAHGIRKFCYNLAATSNASETANPSGKAKLTVCGLKCLHALVKKTANRIWSKT